MPEDFRAMQQQAINQIKEMQARAEPQKAAPPQEKRQTNTPPQPKALPPQNTQRESPFSRLLHMDNDTALILPLMLLLGREGADDGLLLALLYIMS